MATARYWTLLLTRTELGEVSTRLLEEREDGEAVEIAACSFGPFDTAYDVCQWVTRHWAPRARLPLR